MEFLSIYKKYIIMFLLSIILIGIYVFYEFIPKKVIFISTEPGICYLFNKKAPCKVEAKEIKFYSNDYFIAVDCNNSICRINKSYIKIEK